MHRPTRHGLSRIEVLVVIAIFVILVGLIFPAGGVRRIREPANRMQCQNNLKSLLLAIHNYESMEFSASHDQKNKSALPGRHFPPGCFGPGALPEERLSWMVALLPFLDQDAEFKRFNVAKGYTDNMNASQHSIRVFLCPAAKTDEPTTHYVAMAGIGTDAAARPVGAAGNGFMGYDRITKVSTFEDGMANTIALLETRTGLGPWARGGTSNLRGFNPADLPTIGDERPFSGHTGGMNAAMADGSVRFLRATMDPSNLAAMITIADGEPPVLD
jgi:prepilin-type processing-associated H-X9-DG protein